MITCQTFRANLRPGMPEGELLEHLRGCDGCLDFAVQVDSDNFFRAMGGEDRQPPGGMDAFVDDVMAQVRLREAAISIEPRRSQAAWRRMAVAAALGFTMIGVALVYTRQGPVAPAALTAHAFRTRHAALVTPSVTRPVVETYESRNATIVEVPSEGDDVQVVMIFDESLPADL